MRANAIGSATVTVRAVRVQGASMDLEIKSGLNKPDEPMHAVTFAPVYSGTPGYCRFVWPT